MFSAVLGLCVGALLIVVVLLVRRPWQDRRDLTHEPDDSPELR